MKKALAIAWKDLRIAFRDRAGLLLMLLAPLALTLVGGVGSLLWYYLSDAGFRGQEKKRAGGSEGASGREGA